MFLPSNDGVYITIAKFEDKSETDKKTYVKSVKTWHLV